MLILILGTVSRHQSSLKMQKAGSTVQGQLQEAAVDNRRCMGMARRLRRMKKSFSLTSSDAFHLGGVRVSFRRFCSGGIPGTLVYCAIVLFSSGYILSCNILYTELYVIHLPLGQRSLSHNGNRVKTVDHSHYKYARMVVVRPNPEVCQLRS
jgi:hypothetical protein